MKTKEEILAQKTDWVCEQPFSKLKQNILEAMQLYSDQQNKELSVCACKVSDTPCGPNCTCKNPVMSGGCLNCATYGNEEQRKNMAEDIQQRLAEIQRLTKEVEQLRLKVEKWVFSGVALHAKNTRLRELVIQYLDNSTSDNAYGADVRDRIFNELNPKP